LESLVHVGEVGMTIARLGKDRAERAYALVENRGDIGIDRAAAEIDGESRADRAEIDVAEHLGQSLAVVASEGIDLIAVDVRLEQEMKILDRAAHGTGDGKGAERDRTLRRDEPRRRTEAGDAT